MTENATYVARTPYYSFWVVAGARNHLQANRFLAFQFDLVV
jgi:hypothetical protein